MKTILVLALAFPALGATSGNFPASGTTGALSGRVVDRASLEPVAAVLVHLEPTALTFTTDEQGKFSACELEPGSYSLSARRIGYRAVTIRNIHVVAGKQVELLLHMEPTLVELPPVCAVADRYGTEVERYAEGVRLVIDPARQSNQPGAFGDLLRSLRILPVFGMASDFDGLLYARGSSPDQNLILLDDTGISYPYRLRLLMGGGTSAFMPELLSAVEVMPGGFPARYGNRTAAVVHLHTREGNHHQRSLSCRVDLLAASSVFDQPLFAGSGSLLLAARRSMVDLVGPALVEGPYVFPHFADLFAKLSVTPRPGSRIELTVTGANEGTRHARMEGEQMSLSQDSRSEAAAMNWSTTLSKRLLVGAHVSYSSDRNWLQFLDANDASYQARLRYEIEERSANSWLYLDLGPLAHLEAGLSLTSARSLLTWHGQWRNPLFFPDVIQSRYDATMSGAYIQNHFRFSERLDVMLGVRADYANHNNERLLSPRLNVSWRPAGDIKTFLAYGHYYQFPTFLSTVARNEPLLIEGGSPPKAEKATHYIVGAEKELAGLVKGSITGYLKTYSRMLLPKSQTVLTATNSGEGYSAGLELSLDTPRRACPRFVVHAHYVLAQSRYRRVGSRAWIPFKWERRHSFLASVETRLLQHLRAGLAWNYASGRPRLVPGTFVWSGDKLAPYRRVDMRISYSIPLPITKEVCLYLDVFNVANERNVYDAAWDFHIPERSPQGESMIYMMPRMFSIGLSTRF